MSRVQLMPFSTIVFFDNKVKEKISRIMESGIVYYVEFELMRRGYRKCNFLHIDPLRPDAMRIIFENNFHYQVLQSIKKYSGFAHTHYSPNSLEDTLMFTAVCTDEESLKNFVSAYFASDHRTIGELLGYPECDIDFFTKYWGEHLDLVYPAAMNSDREGDVIYFDPRLNIMLRYINIRIIPHFPCSFQCRNAIRFANTIMKLMREKDSKLVDVLLDVLSKPLIFSQVNGIIQVEVYEDKSFTKPLFIIIQSGYSSEEYKLKMIPRWENV